MEETKLYKVLVEMYTRAVDKKTALDQVTYELDYVCLEADNNVTGFIIPDEASAVSEVEE